MAELTPKASRMEPVETTAWKLATHCHQFGGAHAAQHADQAAQETKRDGFDEELQADVARLGAHGDANADLAGAFGDADEHDVHDADAADHQRNAGHGAQQEGDDFGDGIHGVGDFLLVEDVEIVALVAGEAMTLAEQAGDLLLAGYPCGRR